tara:strand:+ start:1736 stop:2038 length:303 start_codon:yes stop_codon:yes gene_type:complete
MTREQEIADKLKEEMTALRRRMEHLQAWKESGYKEPCQEHDWELIRGPFHQVVGSNPLTYILRYKCDVCGMTMEQQAVVEQETLFDEWQEYRENKGDDEE